MLSKKQEKAARSFCEAYIKLILATKTDDEINIILERARQLDSNRCAALELEQASKTLY